MARRDELHDPQQLKLFADDTADAAASPPSREVIRAATADAQTVAIAVQLTKKVYLGTSSWSFPGWNGIIFDGTASEKTITREGLRAYAKHPLLRAVGIDKTFYRPAPAAEFARLRAQVPTDFRFLVKAHDAITRKGRSLRRPLTMCAWLDPAYAIDQVIHPVLDGLGECAGPILFQFSPMGIRSDKSAEQFIEQLGKFIGSLPIGPLYAVEVRDRMLMRPSWAAMLKDRSAVHCYNAHPTQITPLEQSRIVEPHTQRALVCRWMLHGHLSYQAAIDASEPFNRIVHADPTRRGEFAQLCSLAVSLGKSAYVIVNNKAEGCAPRSIELLASAIIDSIATKVTCALSSPSITTPQSIQSEIP